MHIHILGICGTFMGGIAVLAREMGATVTGSDSAPYPPMSTQLEELGIRVSRYDAENLNPQPDIIVIGNALSRGNPEVEAVLERDMNYISGPQWLAEHFLRGRHVLAVAGTHGKTTTSSMLAWVLEDAGLEPGFLIGGIPQNFGISARAGGGKYFVIEADEYDTAFFDKRSKFIHYHPKTLILNNLEFDHADIFSDLDAIKQQFHFLIRTVPGSGQLVINADDPALPDVINKGCWSEKTYFSLADRGDCDWQTGKAAEDYSNFDILYNGLSQGSLNWALMGAHNAANGLSAIAAAAHVGIAPSKAIEALKRFKNVKRRMEIRGTVNNVTVYDDFAHHPTAIASTLEGLRKHCAGERILAILEPRSNTMKMGVHKDTLVNSLQIADSVFIYQPVDVEWSITKQENIGSPELAIRTDIDKLVDEVVAMCRPGDNILVMSNGSFAGIHEKLLMALKHRHA
ncbi:MAG TPA: UDP-N-acetylmuramate:L-alanyl-gamma-D-glutamyl-meso-diaminopimelate ligase [Gammaproteobacteria bacterium]|nr:UDP-N-acetylmuramate:L-alanyl-gamma-D-glutamyl-meso-diaminopimelate ligase [Gammaproteobacteria bacterium]